MFYRKFGSTSALGRAILRHDVDGTLSLLSQGANPDTPDEMGWRPLHIAASQVHTGGPSESVAALLRHGADANAWDAGHNETPILTACDPPNHEVVRMLLTAGADPNVVRSEGESPLRLCVQAGDLATARLLLQHDAMTTIDEYGGIFGLNALALAALDFNVPMIELLLKHNADPTTI